MRKVRALKIAAIANEMAQKPEVRRAGIPAKSIKRRFKKLYNRGVL